MIGIIKNRATHLPLTIPDLVIYDPDLTKGGAH